MDISFEEITDVLHSKLFESVWVSEFGQFKAVVENILRTNSTTYVAQPVELSADLANFAAKQLIVGNDMVSPLGLSRGDTWNRQAKVPFARQGHAVFVNPPQLINHTAFNQLLGFQDLCWLQQIRRATLIVLAPRRWPPFGPDRRRLGKNC